MFYKLQYIPEGLDRPTFVIDVIFLAYSDLSEVYGLRNLFLRCHRDTDVGKKCGDFNVETYGVYTHICCIEILVHDAINIWVML